MVKPKGAMNKPFATNGLSRNSGKAILVYGKDYMGMRNRLNGKPEKSISQHTIYQPFAQSNNNVTFICAISHHYEKHSVPHLK